MLKVALKAVKRENTKNQTSLKKKKNQKKSQKSKGTNAEKKMDKEKRKINKYGDRTTTKRHLDVTK